MSNRPVQPKPPSGRLGAALLALLLSMVVAASIARFDGPRASGQAVLPFLLIIGTAGAIFWVERASRGLGFFTPLAFALSAYVLMFAVVPLADLANGHPLTHHDAWWVCAWFAWFGLLAMYAGYRLAFVLSPSDRAPVEEAGWHPGRERLLAGVLVGVALLSFLLLLNRLGGVSAYVSVFRRRTLLLQRHVPLLVGIGLATPALLLRVGGWLRRPSKGRLAILVITWLPPVLVVSGFLGARFRVAGLVIAMLGAYHFGYRRIRLPILCLVAVMLAWLFVMAGVERNYVGSRQAAPALTRSNFYTRYLVSHDLGEFREFVVTLEGVPKAVEFQHGRTFLSIVPGTPVQTAGQLYSWAFFGTQYAAGTSISPSLLGELYMNFGLAGVLGGMAVFGLLIGLLEGWFRRNRHRIGTLLVYSFSLLPVALELRGDFTSMTSFYLAGVVPLMIGARWIQAGEARRELGRRKAVGLVSAPASAAGAGPESLAAIR